jgi:site-specific DNA recombinase
MRAALYARFSTDQQNPRSIADQLVLCRQHAARIGADVVAEYSDAAISAVAMNNRPGLADLRAAGRAKAFDLVIAEDMSRLSRDGGHPWDLFYEFAAVAVEINTVAEGRVDELVIGLKGTMNAVERKATGARVRRGLSGVIRSGAHQGPAGNRSSHRADRHEDSQRVLGRIQRPGDRHSFERRGRSRTGRRPMARQRLTRRREPVAGHPPQPDLRRPVGLEPRDPSKGPPHWPGGRQGQRGG